MLEVNGISFSAEGQQIFDNISFHVECGEILTILGTNGVGKTTLLKCILGFYTVSKGEILVDNISVTKLSASDRAQRISYVPQFFSLEAGGGFSVIDFILMGRSVHSDEHFSREDEELVISIIEEMGLENFALRDVGSLSGGEGQRVLIARALAQNTKMILLDEPTSSLDLNKGLLVLEQIQKIARRRNTAIVMTMHDINLASLFSDRVLLLNDRSVFAQGVPVDVITKENIHAAYGVLTQVVTLNGVPHILIAREQG